MKAKHILHFTVMVVAVFLATQSLAITFQTTGTNSWSPYTPGTNISTSDEFIISHSVKLYGITLQNGGKITVESGGYLTMKWSANFQSGSSIEVKSGGTLKLSQLTTINYSENFDVYGTIETSSGTMANYAPGELTYHSGASWVMNQYTLANYSNLVINEDADWKNGTVSLIQGETTVNAELSIKNLTLSNNASMVGIGEIEVQNGTGTFSSTGTINGCQGNSCIPPSTVGQTTYLSATLSEDGEVPEQFDGGTLPASSCSTSLQVKENVILTADYQIGELFVNPGVSFVIEPGVTLEVCGQIVNEGTVSVENAGSILQTSSGNENSGSGIYHVYRDASSNPLEYHSVSSPIQSAYIPEVFANENPCDLFCFDGQTQSWLYDYSDGFSTNCGGNPVTFNSSFIINGGDGVMDVARGYFITGDADGTKDFSGTINNGTINVSVYETGLGHQPNWNDDDWNLLGNPYPSALDLEAFYLANQAVLTGNFYFWVDDNSNGVSYDQSNDYAVYNSFSAVSANGSNIPTQYVGSVQGFWAVAQTDGVVTFNNSMRVNGNNSQYFKRSQDNNSVVWIDLTNEFNNYNQTSVGYSETSTDSIDEAQDAPKSEAGTAVAIGSRLAGHNYSIQAIAEPNDYETKWVDLHVATNVTGQHTFKASKFQNIETNIEVWFFDSVTNTKVNLQQDSYTLVLDSNVYESRFKIGFEQTGPLATSVNQLDNNIPEVKVFINEIGLQVQEMNQNLINEVTVYNTLGQLVLHQNVNASVATVNMQSLTNGAYVVHVTSNNGYVTQQKVIWSR